MRLIAHLSDLHFGRHDPAVVEALLADVIEARPHIVVVSGDFTQRAKRHEFAAARAFLDRIAAAGLRWLAVPGNHDIPLYDVGRRFLQPLHRYRRYICHDLCPMIVDEEVAVLGINTARSLTIKEGRISVDQLQRICRAFEAIPHAVPKLLVTHHPLVPLPWGEAGAILRAAGRSNAALAALADVGVHLLLAGHHHRPFSGSAATFVTADHSILVVQAGTATSTRIRGHDNSYNRIRIEPGLLDISVHAWMGDGFAGLSHERYRLTQGRWHAEAMVVPQSERRSQPAV